MKLSTERPPSKMLIEPIDYINQISEEVRQVGLKIWLGFGRRWLGELEERSEDG